MSKMIATNDALAILGLVLLTLGSFLVWLPLGFVVPGVLLIAYTILPDQRTETP